MTQNDYLLKHLKEGKTITAKQAFELHGIQQLGRCIDDIQKQGHTIKRRWIEVPTRHGEGVTKVKQYWLADAEKQGDMFGGPDTKHKGAYSL